MDDDDVCGEADDDFSDEVDDDVGDEEDDDVRGEADDDFDEEDDDDVRGEADDDFDDEEDDDVRGEGDDDFSDEEDGDEGSLADEMRDLQAKLGDDWILRVFIQGEDTWLTAEKDTGASTWKRRPPTCAPTWSNCSSKAGPVELNGARPAPPRC